MKYAIALCLMLCSTATLRAAEPALLAEQADKCLKSRDTNLACIAAGDLHAAAWEQAPTEALLASANLAYQQACSHHRYMLSQMPEWAEPPADVSCAKATALAERGAAAGSVASTYARAELALESDDAAAAGTWLRLAAERGHVDAMMKLGDMLHDVNGVPKDVPASLAWYTRAAALGSADAVNRLANHWDMVGQLSYDRATLEEAMAHLVKLRPERARRDFTTGKHLAYLDFRDANAARRGQAPMTFAPRFCAPDVVLGHGRDWNIYVLPRIEDVGENMEKLPEIARGEASQAACITLDAATQRALSTAFEQGQTPMLFLAGHYFILKPGEPEGQVRSLLTVKMFR